MPKPIPKPGKKSKLAKSKSNPKSKYWKTKSDKKWGELIHKKYNDCLVCGKMNTKLDAHHLISRGKLVTRHSPENGVLLCMHHHMFNPDISPHAASVGFTNFLYDEHRHIYDWVIENQFAQGIIDYESNYYNLIKLIEEL